MVKNKKISVALLGVLLLSLAIVYLLLPKIIASKIKDALDNKVPQHISINYERIEVSLFSSSVYMYNANIGFTDISNTFQMDIQAASIFLEGLSVWNYWLRDRIEIDNLIIDNPKVLYQKTSNKAQVQKSSNTEVSLLPITVNKAVIVDGKFDLLQHNEEEVGCSLAQVDLTFSDLRLNKDTISRKIPLDFVVSQISAQSFQLMINTFNQLKIEKIKFSEQLLVADTFSLKNIYSPQQFSKRITTERDHINLEIPEIQVWNPKFDYNADTVSISSDTCRIINPNAQIFRDKLVSDDVSHKKFYGELLRQLPYHLHVGTFEINGGTIRYKERTDASIAPEEIYFDAIDVVIPTLSNQVDRITLSMGSTIMGKSDLDMKWTLPVLKEDENFQIRGSVKNFNAALLNPFLNSNIGAEAKGFIKELYFTTTGNKKEAQGDMKMKYKNFEFVVLKKDRLGVNKVLTKIGNLFVNSGSKADKDGFRYGEIEVERDPTKSFFNYLWLQVRDGLLSTTTGDGMK